MLHNRHQLFQKFCRNGREENYELEVPQIASLNSLSAQKQLDLSCPYFVCLCLPLISLLCLHLLTYAYTLLGVAGPC